MAAFNIPQKDTFDAYAELWGLALGFAAPLAIKAALKLNLPNIIADGGEAGLTLNEILGKLQGEAPQPANLFRLLRFLVLKNIFRINEESRYGLTSISQLLVSSNEFCLRPLLLMLNSEPMHLAWHNVDKVVTEEGNAFFKAHKMNLWDYEVKYPEFNDLFNQAMTSLSKITVASYVQCYDGFKSIKTLVDVGGGVGSTLSFILQAYPHIHGINYDLPHVVANAPAFHGIQHVAGSALESVPSGDAILMKAVLHGFNDEGASKILQNCARALDEGGRLIICEMVLEETVSCATFDMQMLAGSPGGIERTETEWKNLLKSNGFQRIKFFPTCTPHPLIEAFKH